MLAKANRFTRREFTFLRPRMKKFVAGDFLFFYCRLNRETKLAAVISKKVDKLAVNRNAWRRLVYHFLGTELLKSTQNLAVVCLYKGTEIPDNTDGLMTAWQDFKAYLMRKDLFKT